MDSLPYNSVPSDESSVCAVLEGFVTVTVNLEFVPPNCRRKDDPYCRGTSKSTLPHPVASSMSVNTIPVCPTFLPCSKVVSVCVTQILGNDAWELRYWGSEEPQPG